MKTRKSYRARFWAYVNGDQVKITLEPGQTLSHVEGGPTDEGYDWTETSWEMQSDGQGSYEVERSWQREARDCDGRLSSGGVEVCHVISLRNGSPVVKLDGCEWRELPFNYPAWGRHNDPGSYQRDYSAEEMGY